jgi:hypothetical protein
MIANVTEITALSWGFEAALRKVPKRAQLNL